MPAQTAAPPPTQLADPSASALTLGVVSYLNALPLYLELKESPPRPLAITSAVPAHLATLLLDGRCDLALLPVVDYWRNRARLTPVSDAGIASDGETMTVRVFSRIPPDAIRRLYVDHDSHTSIILAQLLWKQLYNHKLEVVSYQSRAEMLDTRDVQAVLLIGDKVVNQAPRGFGFEVDLGAAWKHLTGLPFVFAAWYARSDGGMDFASLAAMLESARDRGVARAESIARRYAPAHNWPETLAIHYLCNTMRYTVTPDMRTAMQRFFTQAVELELLA